MIVQSLGPNKERFRLTAWAYTLIMALFIAACGVGFAMDAKAVTNLYQQTSDDTFVVLPGATPNYYHSQLLDDEYDLSVVDGGYLTKAIFKLGHDNSMASCAGQSLKAYIAEAGTSDPWTIAATKYYSATVVPTATGYGDKIYVTFLWATPELALDDDKAYRIGLVYDGIECDYPYSVRVSDGSEIANTEYTGEDAVAYFEANSSGSYNLITDGPDVAVDDTTATITWDTSVASTSYVRWGVLDQFQAEAEDGSLVTEHEAVISELEPGETYFYVVCSNATGYDEVCSGLESFTLDPPAAPVTAPVCAVFRFLEGGEEQPDDGIACLWSWILYAVTPTDLIASSFEEVVGMLGDAEPFSYLIGSFEALADGIRSEEAGDCPFGTIENDWLGEGELDIDICASLEDKLPDYFDDANVQAGMSVLVAALAIGAIGAFILMVL